MAITPTVADLAQVAADWRGVRDWTRRIWTTPDAEQVWETRISRVSRAWQESEWRSVAEGVRPSALLASSPDRLPSLTRRASAHGLAAVPLSTTASGGSYSASARTPEPGEAWHYRVAVTDPSYAGDWYGAWERGDDEAIGRLLGFPDCCRAFFSRTWGRKCDTTWWMLDSNGRTDTVELCPDPRNNILLRWLGLRAVPHLPCSFDCGPTRALADRLLPLLPETERGWLLEALSWPVEWSALHGIAEVKTPVVKVSAKTDWTAGKRTLRLKGTTYPEEGATGNVFPYLDPREKRKKLVQLRTAQNGARDAGDHDRGDTLRARARVTEPQAGPHLWTDNGFSSLRAMRLAHAPIVELARQHANGGPVVDLGCGNGELLRSLGLPALGVEKDAERAARAVPDVEVREGDFLRDPELWPGDYELAIVMPGRFVETDVDRVRELLSERAGKVLAYCYGDWLTRYGSVDALMDAAGLRLRRLDGASGQGVEAAIYEGR